MSSAIFGISEKCETPGAQAGSEYIKVQGNIDWDRKCQWEMRIP